MKKAVVVLPVLAAASLLLGCAPKIKATRAINVPKPKSDAAFQLAKAGQAPTAAQITSGDLATVACAEFMKQLKTPFSSDFIEVPEDWDHPESSKKIKVFYYWSSPARGSSESSSVPVVFFNGGPAADSHSSSLVMDKAGVFGSQPFVFIDQRGTGCSDPFPSTLNDGTAIRLTHYGSRGIVRDAEAIRKHLYGQKTPWRAYGQSYGGNIVHRYIETAPEGLDRAIAHGFSIDSPIEWTVARLKSQKRVANDFFEKYPDDLAMFQKIKAAIDPKQCWSQESNSICGPAVMDAAFLLLGFQSSWKSLDDWINSLLLPDGTIVADNMNLWIQNYVFTLFGQGSGLGGNVLSKLEVVPGYSDVEICSADYARLRVEGDDPESYVINECRILTAVKSTTPDYLGQIKADPVNLDMIFANLIARPNLKFFLFSGQKDVFVPYATFDSEVKKLGALVHYESFPNSGHEGFYTEPDVLSAVKN